MRNFKIKQYLLAAIIQIIIITISIVGSFFAFDFESVVLNPIMYFLPSIAILLIVDIVLLLIVFRKRNVPTEGGNSND